MSDNLDQSAPKMCFTCGEKPRHVSKKGNVSSYCFECASKSSQKRKDRFAERRQYAKRDPRPKPPGKAPETRMTVEHPDENYKLRLELIQSRHQLAILRKAVIQAVLNQDLTELETILSPYLGEKALQ